MHAALAADAGMLGAAERRAEVAQKPGVDPDDARFDFRGDAVRPREIARPDGGGEAVVGGVGPLDHLRLGVEGEDVTAGAEDFLGADG